MVLENVGPSQFPLLSQAESEGDFFSRTGQPAEEATSLTLTGCCGVGSAAAKLESQLQAFSLTRGFLRDTTFWRTLSLWAGICPAHSPPSSEYFCVERFGKAPLGHGRALHVKTRLQNVSEAAFS